jgi:hypothetical protein
LRKRFWHCFLSVLLALCSFVFCSKGVCERVFVDAFAAVVNGNVILESDIRFEIAFVQFDARFAKRENRQSDRNATLQNLVNRELLLHQARRFITRIITEKEIQQRIADLDERYGGKTNRSEFLNKMGFDDDFWRIRIRDQLLLETYYNQRLRPFVRVTRDLIDEYIIENQSELGLGEFDDPVSAVPDDHPIRSVIAELIGEKIMMERLEGLLHDLRTEAVIVYPESASDGIGDNMKKNHESENIP